MVFLVVSSVFILFPSSYLPPFHLYDRMLLHKELYKEEIMSLHIAADNSSKPAPSVLMPGDPLRAKFIAENFLNSPVMYSDIRNI